MINIAKPIRKKDIIQKVKRCEKVNANHLKVNAIIGNF